MRDSVPPKLYDLLKHAIDEDIENYSLIVGGPNEKGEGFVGDICFVSLKHKTSDKTYDFVIKQTFAQEAARKAFPIRSLFLNEIYFYEKVWPTFQRFQKEVVLTNVFDKIPKCFVTSSEELNETLVLENIKIQNFQLINKKVPVPLDHFEFIFKEYGKFHALSFAYKEFNPKEYLDLSEELENIFLALGESPRFSDRINTLHNYCLGGLDPVEDANAIEKYKDYSDVGATLFREICAKKDHSDHAVILHGDCWSNNMMFKHDESGKPIDMRLLDLQLSYRGNPVSDLSYCLYAGGCKKVFDNFDHLLKIYLQSLTESLKEMNCKSDVYSFDDLITDWKRYCTIGFTMALFVWRMKMADDDGVSNMSSSGQSGRMIGDKFNEGYFKELTRELILHMYERDFL